MGREEGTATSANNHQIFNIIIILASTFVLCVGAIAAFVVLRSYYAANSKKELPTISISLKDITLEEFRTGAKKTKYPGNEITITNKDNVADYTDVEVRGRGNSTWGLPKPPFQIKFSEKVDLFDLGSSKTWVLLANYVDLSNLRNDIAFKLADMLEEKYATRGEFVKVIVDDKYIGIYYLTHKMETKKGSVDLKDKYGVLMEVDILHRDTEDCIDTNSGVCMTIKDTVADEDEEAEIRDRAVKAFMDDYNKYEAAVRAKDYEALSEIVDVESLAQYFIISEFSVNPDAYVSSLYFYKDGFDDKIHAGPVWDYDYAFANRGWVWGKEGDENIYSPYTTAVFRQSTEPKTEAEEGAIAAEFYKLIDMPEFQEEVKKIFKEKLSGRGEELVKWLTERAELIKEETLADAEKWGFEGVEEDTEELIDWVRRRFDYFEYTYGKD